MVPERDSMSEVSHLYKPPTSSRHLVGLYGQQACSRSREVRLLPGDVGNAHFREEDWTQDLSRTGGRGEEEGEVQGGEEEQEQEEQEGAVVGWGRKVVIISPTG